MELPSGRLSCRGCSHPRNDVNRVPLAKSGRLPSHDSSVETTAERWLGLTVAKTMLLSVLYEGSSFRDSFEILVSPFDFCA